MVFRWALVFVLLLLLLLLSLCAVLRRPPQLRSGGVGSVSWWWCCDAGLRSAVPEVPHCLPRPLPHLLPSQHSHPALRCPVSCILLVVPSPSAFIQQIISYTLCRYILQCLQSLVHWCLVASYFISFLLHRYPNLPHPESSTRVLSSFVRAHLACSFSPPTTHAHTKSFPSHPPTHSLHVRLLMHPKDLYHDLSRPSVTTSFVHAPASPHDPRRTRGVSEGA